MTKRIHIENLSIRLPKHMRSDARTIGSSTANEIAKSIAGVSNGQTGTRRIDEIAVGRVQDISTIGKRAATKVGEILNVRNRK